jgi:hypothetical protein
LNKVPRGSAHDSKWKTLFAGVKLEKLYTIFIDVFFSVIRDFGYPHSIRYLMDPIS